MPKPTTEAATRPQRRRPGKGERTRAKLVDVAAGLFAEHGYAATTFEDLIRAAGVSRGGFYFHFASKEQLALAVLETTKRRWLTRLTEQTQAHPNATAGLRALGPALLAQDAEDPAGWTASALARELSAAPELRERATAVTREWVDFVADLIRRAQVEGGVRPDVDPDTVALLLLAATDGARDLATALEPAQRRHDTFARQLTQLLDLLHRPLFSVDPDS